MTEGVTVTDGNGTHQTLATDPCTVYTTSVLVPQSKVGFGGQGSYTDVSASNPLPVTLAAPTLSASTTLQSGAAANGNGTAMNVAGYETAVLEVTASVAMSGGTTINFEVSPDGSTWQAISGLQPNDTDLQTTTTATGFWQFNVAGYTDIRARISAYSAGTITVTGWAVVAAGSPATVQAQLFDGSGNSLSSTGGALEVANTVQTSGGSTQYSLICANTTNTTSLKASAGQIYSIQAFNNSSTIYYLKLYNKASAPTLSSDTPIKRLLIPANISGTGFVIDPPPQGWGSFTSGIAFAVTGGIGDTDTTAVAANSVLINIDYK